MVAEGINVTASHQKVIEPLFVILFNNELMK